MFYVILQDSAKSICNSHFTDEKTDAQKIKLLAQDLEAWKWGLGFESNLDMSNPETREDNLFVLYYVASLNQKESREY